MKIKNKIKIKTFINYIFNNYVKKKKKKKKKKID